MKAMLDKILLNDDEYHLGPEIWTTDKNLFEDKFPEEFSHHLHKKHTTLHNGDPDKQEGWEDCLEEDDADEIEV
jgi:hypothetical protein